MNQIKSEKENCSICFIASARDYHAVDWYRTVKTLCPQYDVFIVSDMIEGEGAKKIIDASDNVYIILKIDRILFNRQSIIGNIWRNLVKVIVAPFLAYRIRQLSLKKCTVFHAHSMYYIFLCWMARVEFIATPMGSDVLVRPDKSKIYKLFTILSLKAAYAITVDSQRLKTKIHKLCGREAYIVQNGIDTVDTYIYRNVAKKRTKFLSIRAMDSNYRIHELLEARNKANKFIELEFIHPFLENKYYEDARKMMQRHDIDHGRIDKTRMYELLSQAVAVFSIPISDSSPRSVYEAIFCGAIVIVSYSEWIESLPGCMRSRVVIVNMNDENWFDEAIALVESKAQILFNPTPNAIRIFDEVEAMKNVCKKFYGVSFDG